MIPISMKCLLSNAFLHLDEQTSRGEFQTFIEVTSVSPVHPVVN
jgi:hypothetical protein